MTSIVNNNSRLDDAKMEMLRAQTLEKTMLNAYENAKKMAISQEQITEAYFQYDIAARASSKAQTYALIEAMKVYGDYALAHAAIDIFGIDN